MVCGQAGGRTYRHNNLSPTAYFFTAGFLASSLCVSLCSAPLNCKKPISAVLQCNVCTDFASLPPPSQALTSYCLFIPPLHRMLDDWDWDEEHEVLGRWFTRRELALLLAFLTFTSLFTAYFLVLPLVGPSLKFFAAAAAALLPLCLIALGITVGSCLPVVGWCCGLPLIGCGAAILAWQYVLAPGQQQVV